MQQSYPATYSDDMGNVTTTITNDGTSLRMVLRNVSFISTMLDDWQLDGTYRTEQLESFSFDGHYLTNYTLTFQLPIPLVIKGNHEHGILHVSLLLTGFTRDWPHTREELRLQLTVGALYYATQHTHGLFEDALLDVQRQLPPTVQLRICFFCGLSDYSPYGNALFGTLACFRDTKAAYRAVRTKAALFAIWSTMTAFVQETYTCADYEPRAPNTGYRG